MLERMHTGERTGAAHHRHEATALLVGPYGDGNRVLRGDASVVEGSQHLQSREHAIVAVEFAARRLRIDVASGEHNRRRGIASGARRKNIACTVDFDAAAGFLEPPDNEIATLSIEAGECEPPHASLGRGADLRQLHQRSPKAPAIHAKRACGALGGMKHGGSCRHPQPSLSMRILASTEPRMYPFRGP